MWTGSSHWGGWGGGVGNRRPGSYIANSACFDCEKMPVFPSPTLAIPKYQNDNILGLTAEFPFNKRTIYKMTISNQRIGELPFLEENIYFNLDFSVGFFSCTTPFLASIPIPLVRPTSSFDHERSSSNLILGPLNL